MDSCSLLQLLPELLNQSSADSRQQSDVQRSPQWPGDQSDTDQDREESSVSSGRTYESLSQEQEDDDADVQLSGAGAGDGGRDVSPKPVDLDEIEQFLDGITKSHRAERVERVSGGRPAGRDMAAILREVDDLGRRTLSSTSLPGTAAARPPVSPRLRPATASRPSPSASASAATPAVSESALLAAQNASRRVRFSHQRSAADAAVSAPSLAPPGGEVDNVSLSESTKDARVGAFHGLLSQEKKKNLNLTADMILLKQSSLEQEIRLKGERDEHIRDLMTENSSLKAQVEHLTSARAADQDREASPAARLRALEHRLQEQERLLDGFNQENARLYRQLKSVKTEREQLEASVDDLQCDKRLLEARLQASQRRSRPVPEHQRELALREKQLEERWLHVQRAGQEVARLHQKVRRQEEEAVCEGAAARRWDAALSTTSAGCQTDGPPPAPLATTDEAELRAALRQAQEALLQAQADAAQTQLQLKREWEVKVRALETKLRRLHASPARSDADLLCIIRGLKSQLGERERQLTQSRRQLEKSQRTVTGLQRERQRLLAAAAAPPPDNGRTPDSNGRTPENGNRSRRCSRTPTERPQRGSPARGPQKPEATVSETGPRRRASPSRSPQKALSETGPRPRGGPSRSPQKAESVARGRASPVRRGSSSKQRAVDEALLGELQTAIAAVEDENGQLRRQLQQLSVHRAEEIARRDAQIAALRTENQEVRGKLSLHGAEEPPCSCRSDCLMGEAREQMEEQERVIRQLRGTVQRFRQQMSVMEDLERENTSLRETLETLRRQQRTRRPRHGQT